MHPLSKLIICAVMLRGRHRGLPVAIDRAIMLPSELEEAEGRYLENTGRSNLGPIWWSLGRSEPWEATQLHANGFLVICSATCTFLSFGLWLRLLRTVISIIDLAITTRRRKREMRRTTLNLSIAATRLTVSRLWKPTTSINWWKPPGIHHSMFPGLRRSLESHCDCLLLPQGPWRWMAVMPPHMHEARSLHLPRCSCYRIANIKTGRYPQLSLHQSL